MKACSSGLSVGLRDIQQLLPARAPGEQFGIPADRAGVERFLLGAADARQNLADHGVCRPRDGGHANRFDAQRRQNHADCKRKDPSRVQHKHAEQAEYCEGQGKGPQQRTLIGQNAQNHQKQNKHEQGHVTASFFIVPGERRAAST